jgi:HSP20 family protein
MAMRGSNPVSTSNRPRQALARRRGSDLMPSFQWDIDRAFDDYLRTMNFPLAQLLAAPIPDVALPRINMRDTDKAVEVTVEIPGVDQEDIDVRITDGALTVRAEAQQERDDTRDRYTMREVSATTMERTIPIPEGLDIDNARANLRNGMLVITIPKTASAQRSPKRINVNTSEKQSSEKQK